MRDRSGQCPEAHDSRHVCELRSCLAECLFRESPLRHVLDGAQVFELAILIVRRTSNHVQVLDGMVGHDQPVLVLEVAGNVPRAVDHVIQQRHVLRVDSRCNQPECHLRALVKLKNAV